MNLRLCIYLLGSFLIFFGAVMILPLICSLIYQDGDFLAFISTSIITVIIGIIFKESNKNQKDIDKLNRKEVFLMAFLCWFAACIIGSIPYLFIPVFTNPVDALFESIAGFTTTGSSIIEDLSVLPHGILFYRSFTQWLGGMGIIILALAILPRLSVGGMQLMGLEAPGPVAEKITPKLAKTAKKLWAVYVGLTILLIIILQICKMPVFDSIVTSFSTMSTGGFSIKNNSIGGYNSALIEAVITFFMYIAGINFLLHYFLFTGRFLKVFKDVELRLYTSLILLFIFIVSLDLWVNRYYDIWDCVRYASFQVISILTTTGFSTVDFAHWPTYNIFVLFFLMFIGACAGSTSGSIKILRILILLKKGYRELLLLIKPHIVLPMRHNNKVVTEGIVSSISSFLILYISIFFFSIFVVLIFDNISVFGALTSTASSLGNVGPAFKEFGPTHNYHFLSDYSKLWHCFLMLLGRLELYAILVILTPMFWKK